MLTPEDIKEAEQALERWIAKNRSSQASKANKSTTLASLVLLALVPCFVPGAVCAQMEWGMSQTLQVEDPEGEAKRLCKKARAAIDEAQSATKDKKRDRLLKRAETRLKKAIETYPDGDEAYALLARVHILRGDEEAVRETCSKSPQGETECIKMARVE